MLILVVYLAVMVFVFIVFIMDSVDEVSTRKDAKEMILACLIASLIWPIFLLVKIYYHTIGDMIKWYKNLDK